MQNCGLHCHCCFCCAATAVCFVAVGQNQNRKYQLHNAAIFSSVYFQSVFPRKILCFRVLDGTSEPLTHPSLTFPCGRVLKSSTWWNFSMALEKGEIQTVCVSSAACSAVIYPWSLEVLLGFNKKIAINGNKVLIKIMF